MSKWNINQKVLIGQIALCVGLLVLAGSAFYAVRTLDNAQRQALEVEARKVEMMGHLETAVEQMLAAQRGVVLARMLKDEQSAALYGQMFTEAQQEMESNIQALEPLLQTTASKKALSDIRSNLAEWVSLTPQFNAALAAGNIEEAEKLQAGRFRPLYARMEEAAKAMNEAQRSAMDQQRANAQSSLSSAQFGLGTCLLIVLAVAGGVMWMVNSAVKSLRRVSVRIGEGARQVASAAAQVSSVSQSLAQGASEQAASLEETSASTEEINSMVKKNTENARAAADETASSDRLLQETTQKLEGMIDSMRAINGSSEKVSKIIKVIDEIAFQTNILALNAAVEAARAGEAGMGFAVVADEVRNLAQRCAQAARDTSELIEESIRRTNEGKSRLDEVAASVSRVVDNAGRIRLLANEVNTGSQEQAKGIDQIARTVAQMQQVTQSSAASTEEGASAGEEMSSQAEALLHAVGELRVQVGGGNSELRAQEPRPVAHALAPSTASPTVARSLESLRAKVGTGSPTPTSLHAPVKPGASEGFPMDEDFKDF